jgi:hypothetical protein
VPFQQPQAGLLDPAEDREDFFLAIAGAKRKPPGYCANPSLDPGRHKPNESANVGGLLEILSPEGTRKREGAMQSIGTFACGVWTTCRQKNSAC